jgi:hypothetical protein
MARWRRIVAQLRSLLANKHADDDLAREVASHLALLADDFERHGMPPEDARLAARRAYGSVEQAKQAHRDERAPLWAQNALQDLRYGARTLSRSPGFTITAVLTLALGMGANTAIFSLINAVLLRSLPVENPNQLYFVRYSGDAGVGLAPPYPYFEQVQAQTKSFSGVAAFNGPGDLKVRMNGNIEPAYGARVSGDFFGVLGLQSAAGRLLTPADQKLSPAAAVISYDYWQKRFGGEPNAVGTTFEMDARQFTIVGVMQRGFKGMKPGAESDYVLPMTTMLLGPHDGAGIGVDYLIVEKLCVLGSARNSPAVIVEQSAKKAELALLAQDLNLHEFAKLAREHLYALFKLGQVVLDLRAQERLHPAVGELSLEFIDSPGGIAEELREGCAYAGLRPRAFQQDAVEDFDLEEPVGLLFKEPSSLIYRGLYDWIVVAGERNLRAIRFEEILIDMEAGAEGFERRFEALHCVFLFRVVQALVIHAGDVQHHAKVAAFG